MSESYYLSREVPRVTPPERLPDPNARRSCNRHDDCDAADERSRTQGQPDYYGRRPTRAEHCHSDDCEECFGK